MTAGDLQDLTINFCKEYCKDFDANPKDRKCVGCIRRHDFQKGALGAQQFILKQTDTTLNEKIRLIFRRTNSCQVTEDSCAKWIEIKTVEAEIEKLNSGGAWNTPWEVIGYEVVK